MSLAIDFNEVFLTNAPLRKQVTATLNSWAEGKNPPSQFLGICGNLKKLYPEYWFGHFVTQQSLQWPNHRTGQPTSFPICDLGFTKDRWKNPERLDLCRFLANLLEQQP